MRCTIRPDARISIHPCRQVKEQAYCLKPEFPKERKRRWHRKKLLDDPEYVQNRRDAQSRWREAHRDYWQGYRKTHPAYVEKNRQRQRERNRVRTGRTSPIAKIDAAWGENHIIPGRYALIPPQFLKAKQSREEKTSADALVQGPEGA